MKAFALAALLLLGAVALAGWALRKPLMELVHRFSPGTLADATLSKTPDPLTPPAVPKSVPVPAQRSSEGNTKDALGENHPLSDPNSSPGSAETVRPASPAQTGAPKDPQLAAPQAPPSPASSQNEPAVAKAVPVDNQSPLSTSPTLTTPADLPSKPGPGLMEIDPSTPQLATPDPASPDLMIQAPQEVSPAVESLKAFLATSDLDSRLKHTLGAETMRPLMERYYARNPVTPITVDQIGFLRYDPSPQVGGGAHCVFMVSNKDWEFPIPVMLQEERDGYKVDWLAFVEFKDDLLFKFLNSPQEEKARFHVGISRTHYFDDDVPDLAAKDCFKLQPPSDTFEGFVFVAKDSPLAAELRQKISWDTRTSYVIVELQWKKMGPYKWVELSAVPQLNWYSLPSQDEPPSTSETSESKAPAAPKPVLAPKAR